MKRYILPILLSVGWAGCSEKVEFPQTRSDVQFEARILPAEEGTRTSFSGSTVSFVSGDKIGVSDSLSSYRNVLFTRGASGWTSASAMYWYNTNSTDAFYAYYPYNASNQGYVVTMPALSAQSVGATMDPASDMMVAVTRQARTAGNVVPLVFSHAFALLQFEVSAPAISLYTLQTLTVTGGNPSGGSAGAPYGMFNKDNPVAVVGYNIQTRSLAVTTANNTSTNFNQSFAAALSGTGVINLTPQIYYMLVLPGSYANPVPSFKIKVNSALLGTRESTPLNLPNTSFVPGTKYVYKVNAGGLIGLSVTDDRHPQVKIELLRTESPAVDMSGIIKPSMNY